MKIFAGLMVLAVTLGLAAAQSNPGAREDQEADRQKLLRAVDQLDTMSTQVETIRAQSDQQKAQIDGLKADLAEAKNDVAQLKNDVATLKAAIEKLDAARAEERDVLLKKVGEIVTEALKSKAPPAPVEEVQPAAEVTPSAAASGEKGYFYTVKKGDNLHDIAAAYVAQGVKVTVDDIRKANNLSKTAYIHTGQKLLIPKKD